jgi:hypothetical protein
MVRDAGRGLPESVLDTFGGAENDSRPRQIIRDCGGSLTIGASTAHVIHQHGRRDPKRIHFTYLVLFQKLQRRLFCWLPSSDFSIHDTRDFQRGKRDAPSAWNLSARGPQERFENKIAERLTPSGTGSGSSAARWNISGG